ncbi:formyltransferase family protein [Sungkyunkwania multivorans]|uniref:phosphoribosylglycinamide formyltransferase 1 n=1 Tax=Sungkyunkwania multivorans TaxID=1173618 RepID=A0ABW3CZB5_9FLAO
MTKKGRVALFSPNPGSLYSTSVCELLIREGIVIEDVFVKKFTIARFKDEFSRDGARLLKKIWNKLVLRDKAYSSLKEIDNIISFRERNKIQLKNLKELSEKGIKVHFVNDLNDALVEKTLKAKKVDAVVFTGGGLIRKNILDASGAGVLNCHMGKLPEYRGMDVVEWPLLLRDFNNLGFTVHFMDRGVDTGDILKVFDVKLIKNETIRSLRARFEPIMTKAFAETIVAYLNGEITRSSQRIEDGKQYYIIDKHLHQVAESNLITFTSN